MTGEVGILNVGAGDTKLTFDPKKPDEVKRAASVVKDMLNRGFALLIQIGEDEKGPVYRRAHDFDEATAEYIIVGAPDNLEVPNVKKPAGPPSARRQGKATETRIPATGTKALAVARTAGG